MLDAGPNTEVSNKDYSTPLHLTVSHRHVKAVKLLSERHANHKAKNDAQKMYLALANDNRHAQVSTLLSVVADHGADDGLSATSIDTGNIDGAKFLASTK